MLLLMHSANLNLSDAAARVLAGPSTDRGDRVPSEGKSLARN